MLDTLQSYYGTIREASASIADHHEKQKFLKVLYEHFYKAYNPKGADRLGVVYTPNEVVHFMIEGTEYLLERHFNKALSDKDVEILDPATGTGTFITDLIEYIPKQNLAHKFKEEIHANEVAILPYYIANLNIEYTYKQKMGYYEEFKNICFVDTLDNTAALAYKGKQSSLFGLSTENAERIKKQNSKRISVIIGNPPYNANQQNENENNKNREYYFDYKKKTGGVDGRIRDTFIRNSTAQKSKVYDMYARFYRWSMDRIDKNGIITFITNRSFIESRTFDGFRKCIQDEFSYAYIIDTKSDVRANSKIAGTTHNVFGIQTGVAIMFLVRKESHEGACRIEYVSMDDFWRKEEKLAWLKGTKLKDIPFEHIVPDKTNGWIKLGENDFENLIPTADKNVKLLRDNKAIFQLFSLGAVSNRDEWVYDFDKMHLQKKVAFFCEFYNKERFRWNQSDKSQPINDFVDRTIKWTEELEKHLVKNSVLKFDSERVRNVQYRPFVNVHGYFDRIITHRIYQNESIWGLKEHLPNKVITLTIHPQVELLFFCSKNLVDQGFGSRATTVLPLYRYNEAGERFDNITDWGLNQFQTFYGSKTITKEDIFNYTYAVLHNPIYRKKYVLNLKREFPRLPFYRDFEKWSDWGKRLMGIHIHYETATPFPLETITSETKKAHKDELKVLFLKSEEPEALYSRKPKIKAKLKAGKQENIIEIDELTVLTGIPSDAWEYRLGHRSALEWVLDQYKEKKVGDPTIAANFDNYRFASYKVHVIDLLKRICTVSIETMKIIREMESESA